MTPLGRSFGEIHFGKAKLGNTARTRRLVKVADALVRHPGGTLPLKMNDPAALHAMYRLMQRPEVTHATVLAAHQAETLTGSNSIPGRYWPSVTPRNWITAAWRRCRSWGKSATAVPAAISVTMC